MKYRGMYTNLTLDRVKWQKKFNSRPQIIRIKALLLLGIDLEQPSEENQKDGEDGSRIVSVNMEVATVSTPGNAVHNTQNPTGCTFNCKPLQQAGVEVLAASDPDKNLEPHDGMEFDSREDAFAFYKEYAKSVGFTTIIKASCRSRISGNFIDAKFVCTRYGSGGLYPKLHNSLRMKDAHQIFP